MNSARLNAKTATSATKCCGKTQDLVQKVQAAGMRLPCLSILGDVASMQTAEVIDIPNSAKHEYVMKCIDKSLTVLLDRHAKTKKFECLRDFH